MFYAMIKDMKRSLAALFLGSATLLAHAACPSGAVGPTMNWAGAVCEWRHETDDVLSEAVQRCLNDLVKIDHIPSAPAEDCGLNTKYKTEICRSRVKHGRDRSMSECLKSVESIPPEVSRGIGG